MMRFSANWLFRYFRYFISHDHEIHWNTSDTSMYPNNRSTSNLFQQVNTPILKHKQIFLKNVLTQFKVVVWSSGTAAVQAIWCHDITVAWVRIPSRKTKNLRKQIYRSNIVGLMFRRVVWIYNIHSRLFIGCR